MGKGVDGFELAVVDRSGSLGSCASVGWLAAVGPVVGFCLLTAVLAQVRVPVPGSPVPTTLQTLAVLLAGFSLSPVRALVAMSLYLLAGSLLAVWPIGGLTFFAGSTAHRLWPTAGYLVGFLVAAPLVSMIRGTGRAGVGRLLIAGTAGTVAIFVLGVMWLAWAVPGGWIGAIVAGVVPFLPQAVVKLGLAVALVVTVRRFPRQRGRRLG